MRDLRGLTTFAQTLRQLYFCVPIYGSGAEKLQRGVAITPGNTQLFYSLVIVARAKSHGWHQFWGVSLCVSIYQNFRFYGL